MKIVIDARESGTTTGRYVDKLVEHLHGLKPAHEFVLLTKSHRMEFLRGLAPTFKVIECPYKEFTFGEQIGYLKQVKSLQADLVHFPIVQQPVFYKSKVVTTMQDLTTVRFLNPLKNQMVLKLKREVYKWVNKRVAQKSAHLITPSEFVKQDVMNFCHVPADKITVTLEAAGKIPDQPEVVPALDGKQFILYIGRPMPHKNLPRLIDAFEILQKDHPDLILALGGKTDPLYQNIEDDVKVRGLKNVVFTGWVSEGQLRWMYENTACYVFPSLSEGFGLPGLEAMMHGAPVASSNLTSLPEVHGDAAHTFNPLDINDMAEKIADVLNDPILRDELKQKGPAQAAKFSWTRMAQQTLDIYNKVLDAPK